MDPIYDMRVTKNLQVTRLVLLTYALLTGERIEEPLVLYLLLLW